jgi:hypothetical protein
MDAIRIIESCSTAHRDFVRGEVAEVGQGLSAEDAATLVSLGRAVVADKPTPKKGRQDDRDA